MIRCTFERIGPKSARCSRCGHVTGTHGIEDLSILVRRCSQPEAVQPVQPCQYRGKYLRVEKCKPCQAAGGKFEIYFCEQFGECSLNKSSKRKPDGTTWNACSTCEMKSQVNLKAVTPDA